MEIMTDAQGLPFRCVVLVVVCVLCFFGTAVLLSGISIDEGSISAWTLTGLGAMMAMLGGQIFQLTRKTIRKGMRKRQGRLHEPLIDVIESGQEEGNMPP